MTERTVPPTFVAPALSAFRWAAVFLVGMVAHQDAAWLALAPFSWQTYRALIRLNTYIYNRGSVSA